MEKQMDITPWVSPILSILFVLAFIAGLWIAGTFLPLAITWIHSEELQDILSRPFARNIVWLALGGLFSLPLMDFVILLGDMANIILNPQAGSGFSTLLGTIPQVVYFAFFPLLMLLVYGVIFWSAMDFMATSEPLTYSQRIFLVLSIASLVHQGMRVIFAQVFSFQIPTLPVQQNYGIPGFLVEILIGFVIFFLIVIGLKRFLPAHPVSSE
jgi:hypothetical protein